MDGVQKVLIIVIVSLTTLLLVVGVQVILIIADLRKALKKINGILEDSLLGGGLIRPDKLSGILELFKRGKKMRKHGETGLDQSPAENYRENY